jgi:hypothetical protein
MQTLRATRLEYCEQLTPLDRLQIRNMIHVINSVTEINLNLS